MTKKLTKLLALVLCVALLCTCLAACGSKPAESGSQTESSAPSEPANTFEEGTAEAVASSDTTEEASKFGGTMKLNFNGATASLDPAEFNTNQNYVPGYHIYESPLQVANDGTIWANVCTYDLSEDGLTLTLTCREGVTFHNGDTVDINDVVASITRFLNYSSSGMTNFGSYIADTAVDAAANSVTYTLSAPAPLALLTIGELKGGCKVMPAEIAEAHMSDYITADDEIVGTGPYKLGTWNRDRDLTLVRYEDYAPYESGGTGPAAAKMAYFDEIYCSVAADQTARTNGMIGGNFDYSTSILTDMADQLKAADCWSDKNWNGWSPTIVFNLSDANADSIINDVNFRKAVRACLDADQILLSTKTDPSQYSVGSNPVMSASSYYNDILENNVVQNLDEAKSYLEAANYNGETIVWWCADSDSYYTTALPASEMLKAIGVNVDLQVKDVTTYESSYNDPTCGDFDICCRETQKSYLHPLLSQFVSSYAMWQSDARTEVLERLGSSAAGSEESLKAYEDFCTLVRDEVPYIILGDFGTVCWYSKDMVPDHLGVDMYWWNSYFATAE